MGLKLINTGDADALPIRIQEGATGTFTSKGEPVTLKGGEEIEIDVAEGEVVTSVVLTKQEQQLEGLSDDEQINLKNQPVEGDKGTPANSLSPAQKNGDDPLPPAASTTATSTNTAAGTGTTAADEDDLVEGEVYDREGVQYVGAQELDENDQPTGKIVLKAVSELDEDERQELVDAGKLSA